LQHEWLGSLALELTASRKERYESGTYTLVCDHYTWLAADICVGIYSYTHTFRVFVSTERKHVKEALRDPSRKVGLR
jgi:hypothetical protein